MTSNTIARRLMAGSALAALALTAAPSFAQIAAPTTAAAADTDDKGTPEIVVTGTLFRSRTATEGASPLTVLTADALAKRGFSQVTDALQTISANGAGTLPSGFSAGGGAFANGAASVSLRGLTTDSTLVLFDGLRAAYYPLSDDGTRNFVDLNTVPSGIIDRIDVLKDGASSTYGADAVAGVVNIQIKKQIIGLEATAEGGVTQRMDGGNQHVSVSYGFGDLETQRFNVYVNGEYYHEDPIWLRDRGYPFNSRNYSGFSTTVGGTTVYGVNQNPNGLKGNGTFGGTVGQTFVPIVRPSDASGTFIPGSSYQLLNPAAGCRGLTPHVVGGTFGTVCEQNLIGDFVQAQGKTERIGGTIHATAQVTDDIQAYAMFTYYQDELTHSYRPGGVRNSTNTGDYSTTLLTLPPTLTAGPNAGQLNPNNPFAAAGQYARLYFLIPNLNYTVSSLSKSYRGAAGVTGSFGDGFHFNADVTGMKTTLDTTQNGYIYIQGLLDVIADGSYNFRDPGSNSQAVLNHIAPTNHSRAESTLYEGNANIQKDLFTLPSGNPLQIAVGGAVRYESLNDPSANPDNAANPTQQYFSINGFGAIGHRTVESGYFEINAPILKVLELNGSGRYDRYSGGLNHFSPKIGVQIKPTREITFRGTFSKGFRVPSFAESNALPTIGFSNPPAFPASFIAQHLDTTGKADAYTQYQIGLNTTGTPGLKPEKSTNFTGGFVAQPTRWLSLTADYYHIKKTDVIVGADPTAAINAYYLGQPIPTGFTILQDPLADDLHPTAQRRIYSVSYGFVNAASALSTGIDAEATAVVRLAPNVKLTSSFSGTYVLKNNLKTADGLTQRYAGSLGPCNITSCSGTPKFRANWQNTLDVGKVSLTGTAYYTSGYKTTAEDVGGAGTIDDCSTIQGAHALYDDGTTPVQCHVKHFITVDTNLQLHVTDKFTIYGIVYNLFDAKPPLDFVTYGQNGYNPAWAQSGIIGRSFKIGVNVKLK